MRKNPFQRFLDGFLNLLYPHKCFLCGRILPGDGWVCDTCALDFSEDPCPCCGKEFCICHEADLQYDGATAPLRYDGEVRRGLHRFKYRLRGYYAPFLANIIAQRLESDFLARGRKVSEFDGIVYVPMHWKKERAKGYNPVALVSKELSDLLHVPVVSALRHTENRQAQMELTTREAREGNAAMAFVRGDLDLTGTRLFLVDDVITTGATMCRCARLLKDMGAVEVYALSISATVYREGKTSNKKSGRTDV